MNYWLLKSEPTSYSIDNLKRDKRTAWEGVRNYQARNFMQQMQVGDLCLFYHSSTEPIGVFGVAKITKAAYPDPSQFKTHDSHFDSKATKEKPIWFCPDITYVETFKEPFLLGAIKADPALRGIMVAAPGSRLSVQPVSEKHFNYITNYSKGNY